ncbi:hypothetical protein [Glaciihabitans sp. UYNi722]
MTTPIAAEWGVQHVPDHRSLEEGPDMYDVFQRKEDGCIKVVVKP